MARCSNLNCEPRDIVKATTDIAGPGVLCAYLVSAILAIAAIVWGYLSDSLPESYLNETDRTVIASFQVWLASTRSVRHSKFVYHKIRSLLSFGRPSRPHRKLTRGQREVVVKRFILTLSDQQLATGLAILIAAVANQCILTVWEFQLAFSLAWFSSTTHLATLDCLREYFLDHGAVRNWRVGGMIALLILLMYSLVMSTASVDTTIPTQCTFSYFGNKGVHQSAPLDIFDVLSAALTLVLLTWQYLVRIRWSYKNDDDRATHLERAMFELRTRQHRKALEPSKPDLEYIIQEAVNERVAYRRRRELEKIRNSKGLQRHALVAWRASATYSESFLSLGPMLTFMIAFGFTQLYLNRWESGTPLDIDTSMSIGQITPLFLLILPVLVAAEAYYEVQDSTDIAQSNEIAKELAYRPKQRGHRRGSSPGTFRLRAGLRAYNAFEPHNLEPIHSGHDGDYDALLPSLKRFFYLETKLIADMTTALRTDTNKNGISLVGLRANLVSSYHVLIAQEYALKVTTLSSLIEYAACSFVSAALGILVYIQGSAAWTTIVAFILFGLCVVYKVVELTAYIMEARFEVDEADYKRLLIEARKRQVNLS